ncbi:MAG: redox-regulated ATPase YchF [Candidatus Sericytochromatia bacterium]|nr:redox-regulated ATPase YchF [Candidatus Sericytochromatia bacterium]
MLRAGIVGLPNVGKSSLFNALTRAGAQAANYPFCTIEPNVGIVTVPDDRLGALAGISRTQTIIPTAFEFVDIAGLVRGASKGEGLGNQFLAHIREVDAIVHVVRCFEDDNVTHVDGSVDPVRDLQTIGLELALADLGTVEKVLERHRKQAKSGQKESIAMVEALEPVREALDAGRWARTVSLGDESRQTLRQLSLLTMKPVIYACNVAEEHLAKAMDHPLVQRVAEVAREEGADLVPVSAAIEAELSQLDPAEAAEYLASLGVTGSGLDKLIQATYRTLDLITYFTAGEKEVRAWTIRRGTLAPGAAGVIHSDFERGFIRAEVIGYDDLVRSGSESAAKDAGVMRLEGKAYEVRDGDVMHFRFNV